MAYLKNYVYDKIEILREEKQDIEQRIYILNSELIHDSHYLPNGKQAPWVNKNKKQLQELKKQLLEIDAELDRYKISGLDI